MVTFALTAGSGSGPTPSSFTLNANGTTGSSTFTNSNAAGTADIDITLSSTQNGNRTITWTATCVAGAASPEVTIANTTDGAEPSTDGVMTVSQDIVSLTDTVVAYSVAGTATSGTDYTALSGTVTIPAGSTSADITIPVIDDADIEGSETVIVTLTSITSGTATLGTTVEATNTIADDDSGINDLIAQAFETQTHNYISRRLDLLARSSPSIHRNSRKCGRSGRIQVDGDPSEIVGSFGISSDSRGCVEQDVPHIWAEGQFAYIVDTELDDEATRSTGSFFVGYAGVGLPVNRHLTIGLMGQIDWFEDKLESRLGETAGTGWAVGPYALLQLGDNLQFDMRALWGQSDNNIEQEVLGSDFSGSFKTSRWIVDANLTGEHDFGEFLVKPNLGFFYMNENWSDYRVTDGTRNATVDGSTLDIGNLSAGLWVGRKFEFADFVAEPYVSGELYWNFQNPGIIDSTGLKSDRSDFAASLSVGLGIASDNTTLDFEATVDGIGPNSINSYSAKIGLKREF